MPAGNRATNLALGLIGHQSLSSRTHRFEMKLARLTNRWSPSLRHVPMQYPRHHSTLALTIAWFPDAGHFSSYCRRVEALEHRSGQSGPPAREVVSFEEGSGNVC